MDNNQKNITLDDLAIMVAKGFQAQNERFDRLENEMQALRSSVNNYLELSDKRYLELKAKQNVIVGWVKQIADKTGIPISLEDLEKAV